MGRAVVRCSAGAEEWTEGGEKYKREGRMERERDTMTGKEASERSKEYCAVVDDTLQRGTANVVPRMATRQNAVKHEFPQFGRILWDLLDSNLDRELDLWNVSASSRFLCHLVETWGQKWHESVPSTLPPFLPFLPSSLPALLSLSAPPLLRFARIVAASTITSPIHLRLVLPLIC